MAGSNPIYSEHGRMMVNGSPRNGSNMTQSFEPSPMAETLRYYILREPGSVIVPLVPADLIPMAIHGVPRQLSHRQMAEGGWKFVAETFEPVVLLPNISSRQTVSLPSPPTPLVPKFVAPDHVARAGQRRFVADPPKRILSHSTIRPLSAPMRPHTMDETPNANVPLSDAGHGPPRALTSVQHDQRIDPLRHSPSGIVPDLRKKEYCTHWIKTGECNFESYGCKFKHEMPDKAKRNELGFLRVPRWYQEKTAIGIRAQTWMQQRATQQKENGEAATAPAMLRTFDPTKLRDPSEEPTRRDTTLKPLGETVLQKESDQIRAASPTKQARMALPRKEILKPITEPLIDFDTPCTPPSSSSPSETGSDLSAMESSNVPLPSPVPAEVVHPPTPTASAEQAKQAQQERPSVRRLSQISWSSGDSDSRVLASKQAAKCKVYPKKSSKQNAVPSTATTSTPASAATASASIATTPAPSVKRNSFHRSRHSAATKESKNSSRTRHSAPARILKDFKEGTQKTNAKGDATAVSPIILV